MKTMKIMGIIGIIWFSLLMLVTMGTFESYSSDNQDTAVGCAMLMFFYGLAYSIVGLSAKSESSTNEYRMNSIQKQIEVIEEKLNNPKN
jgi:hypothetical protein